MRIALVNSEYGQPAGIGAYTANLAEILCSDGHQVSLLHKEECAPEGISSQVALLPVSRKPSPQRLKRALGYRFFWEANLHLEYARGVSEALRDLHAQSPLDMVEIPEFYGEACMLKGSLPFPFVCRLHTPYTMVRDWNGGKRRWTDWWVERMERETVQRADGVSSPSKWLLNAIPASWRNGRRPETVLPYPLAGENPKHDGKLFEVEIAFAGRLERRKGVDILFEVLPGILADFREAGAVIAGHPMPESQDWLGALRANLQRAGLEDRCRILGRVPHEKARQLIARADIVVVPSRAENFPNVILEAMQSGSCVVASRAGGIPEMLEDETTGLLYSPDAGVGGLRERLKEALRDPLLRRKIGSNAMEKAQSEFDPHKIAGETIRFYEEVRSHWKK